LFTYKVPKGIKNYSENNLIVFIRTSKNILIIDIMRRLYIMKKNYYNNNFFAKPYEYDYLYDNPYDNFNEIKLCPLMRMERNFWPMMKKSVVFQDDFNEENEYNENYECRHNVYGDIPYEDSLPFQSMRGFKPENFGPMIMAMPVLIDFDDEDD
jgi:hypothetical protein